MNENFWSFLVSRFLVAEHWESSRICMQKSFLNLAGTLVGTEMLFIAHSTPLSKSAVERELKLFSIVFERFWRIVWSESKRFENCRRCSTKDRFGFQELVSLWASAWCRKADFCIHDENLKASHRFLLKLSSLRSVIPLMRLHQAFDLQLSN